MIIRILAMIPDLEEHKQGRDILLAFKEDVAMALRRAREDCDNEAMHLARSATIVRREMMMIENSFDGSFDQDWQHKSVPKSLLSLVNMILYGPNIKTQASNANATQAGLSIAQLLQYNSYSRRRKGPHQHERHSRKRETPLPIYLGLSVHAKTRSRELVDNLYDLGLSVSYDRVMSISTDLGNGVCRRFEEEKVVCPTNLRKRLFTTAAIDNIDHNQGQCERCQDAIILSERQRFGGYPPTEAALLQHTKRAVYQAGHCWGQTLLVRPHLPSPSEWGWVLETDGWQPFWTNLPEVTASCRQLVKCGCSKGCRGNCSCKKSN